MAVAKPKKWMKGAVKKPGAFTAYCKGKGYEGVTDKCIEEGIAAGGRTAKRAHLARTFRRIKR
jgi:hypothetical protein